MAANERQEGGSHYRDMGERQHWDLVIDYDWDYFQSQVIKYLMRWKTKYATTEKRLEDLKKARHFLDKYIEHYKNFEIPQAGVSNGVIIMRGSPQDSDDRYSCEGFFGDMTQLYKCRYCRGYFRSSSLETIHTDHDKACLVQP